MRYRATPTDSEAEIKKIKELIRKKKIGIETEEFVLIVLEKHLKRLEYQKGLKIGHSF